jgi:hypothetical protein
MPLALLPIIAQLGMMLLDYFSKRKQLSLEDKKIFTKDFI